MFGIGIVGIIIAAALAAGSAAYSSEEQKSIAKKDRERRASEAAAATAESDRIARETKPTDVALTETEFGVGDTTADAGSTQDFLIPRTSALGTSGRSGLGFSV